jgi:hypothetical protein
MGSKLNSGGKVRREWGEGRRRMGGGGGKGSIEGRSEGVKEEGIMKKKNYGRNRVEGVKK